MFTFELPELDAAGLEVVLLLLFSVFVWAEDVLLSAALPVLPDAVLVSFLIVAVEISTTEPSSVCTFTVPSFVVSSVLPLLSTTLPSSSTFRPFSLITAFSSAVAASMGFVASVSSSVDTVDTADDCDVVLAVCALSLQPVRLAAENIIPAQSVNSIYFFIGLASFHESAVFDKNSFYQIVNCTF